MMRPRRRMRWHAGCGTGPPSTEVRSPLSKEPVPRLWISLAACYRRRVSTNKTSDKKLFMPFVDRAISRIIVAITLAGFALVFSQAPAGAESRYPDKPVRIVLPFAAGGVADITARIIADRLSEKLGQRFYIENQAGAGGIAAARTVISSPPDGYTLALLSNGTAVSVSLFEKLPFDPLKDFAPISSLGTFDFIFATSAEPPFKTLADFVAAAKEKPGTLNVGTINVGSTQNLSAELFKTTAGVDMTIVPFRSSPDVLIAL